MKQTRQRIGKDVGFVEVWYRRRFASLDSFDDFAGLVGGTAAASFSCVSAAGVDIGAESADAFCGADFGFVGFRRERAVEGPCLRGFML